MGHGNDRGPGDLTLAAAAAAFHKADPHVWLATVEGANSFDNVLPELKASGAKRVWLQPFMIVAGDHANNDLAGPEEDSWASRIKAAGMTPMPNLKGLGQLKGIQDIFLSHTQNAVVDLANTKKADKRGRNSEESEGEGEPLLEKGSPFPPPSLPLSPPKTLGLIESLFAVFPVNPKNGLWYGIALCP